MKIRLLSAYNLGAGDKRAGDEVNISDTLARQLILCGHAEPILEGESTESTDGGASDAQRTATAGTVANRAETGAAKRAPKAKKA